MKRHSFPLRRDVNYLLMQVCLTALSILASIQVAAQGKKVSTSSQQWLQYYNQVTFSRHWTWLTDAGFRWKNDFKTPSQYLVRTGLSYQLSDALSIGAGLATFAGYSGNTVNKREYRSYEDMVIKQNFQPFSLMQRLRIEQRYFRNLAEGNYVNDNYNWRFRYRLQATLPVIKMNSQRLLLTAGDEIFINAGKQVNTIFDQNRLLVGPVWEFSKSISFTALYNGQFAELTSGGAFARTRVIWLSITTKFKSKSNPSQ